MEPTTTRNFALIGHASDGKTTLGEALLHRAGATPKPGSVDQGTSVLNTLPEERDGHAHTITSHVFSFDLDGGRVTLVDTPGHPNFQPDGRIALQALDAAVVVVSAVDGAKVGTHKMLGALDGRAAIAFVNAMDHERADFDAAIASLAAGTDRRVVALGAPIGAGAALEGVVELVAQRSFSGGAPEDVPADAAEEAETRRLELVEAVAETDDALLEHYLENGELADDELRRGLVAGVRSGALLPVIGGSAATGAGVDVLLAAILELLPSAADRGPWAAVDVESGRDTPVAPEASAPLAAIVFKTLIDRYAGTLSVFRIVSGTVRSDSTVLDATTGEKVRIGKLFRLQGDQHVDANEAGPGEIVAVAKVKGIHTGDVLTAEKGGVRLPSPTIPQGVLSYAISAKSQGDEDKVYASLGRLVEEDPTLQLGREASTGEFLLTGMGELHIRTTVHKLARMFDCEVDLATPKVPYRETILGRAENVEGKLKKQSGGKGMFGVCYLSIEPNARGAGIEFLDEIVGGAIPRNLIPAVEKGIHEAADAGPLAGYPVVDVKVHCIDGKHHSVDSNEMAFKLAGSFGFKAALEQARPALLEPIMSAEIVVPDESVGDIMGDISSRRGRVQSTEAIGASTVVRAQIPMAEMLEYASALTSLTGGKGDFHMDFSHYDPCPKEVQEKVIAKAQAAARTDD
ncbi:MAG: elongation factor G [Myxococcales bacterium]|nr:elongation factor G [Myxococcales bacterium]